MPPDAFTELKKGSAETLVLAVLAGVGAAWIGHWLGYSLGIWISKVFDLEGFAFKDMVVMATPLTMLVISTPSSAPVRDPRAAPPSR